MSDACITFTASALRCAVVRDYLKSEQAKGRKILFDESRTGSLSYMFKVRGARDDLMVVQERIATVLKGAAWTERG